MSPVFDPLRSWPLTFLCTYTWNASFHLQHQNVILEDLTPIQLHAFAFPLYLSRGVGGKPILCTLFETQNLSNYVLYSLSALSYLPIESYKLLKHRKYASFVLVSLPRKILNRYSWNVCWTRLFDDIRHVQISTVPIVVFSHAC